MNLLNPSMAEKSQRKKYHSFVPLLFYFRKEHILPAEFRAQIPYSTQSTWRHTPADSYLGAEFSNLQEEGLEWVELFLKYRRLKKTVTVLSKAWTNIADLIQPVLHKKEHTERILDEMQLLLTCLPKQTVLALTGMSSSGFYQKLRRVIFPCLESPLNLCLKENPQQLTPSEIGMIRKLYETFIYWPVTSIAHEARRKGWLFISNSTWYKYLRLLGLQRKKYKGEEKKTGLQTSKPNQFLHVDTTFFKCRNGISYAIVFVSDNFSKAILGWHFCEHKTAANVKEALLAAIRTVAHHYPEHLFASLVSDGGRENSNATIRELLAATDHPAITQLIALKDISFSNSPIEAIHKIMKRYLRIQNPENETQLRSFLKENVYDYNVIRPHTSLKGYTPMEVYTQQLPDMDFSESIKQAKRNRISSNQKQKCRTECAA